MEKSFALWDPKAFEILRDRSAAEATDLCRCSKTGSER
jgi:hypothetical protein